jgi:5'-nucleotidase
VSEGFTYSYALHGPPGRRVDASSIRLNGRPIAHVDRVSISVISFLASDGDGFTAFLQGTNRVVGMKDIDALVEYFKARSPVKPGTQNRIVRMD